MSKLKDIRGQRFFRLTAISHETRVCGARTRTFWHCQCECGNIVLVMRDNLSRTQSCGCWRQEASVTNNLTHGMTGTPEWLTWTRMKSRCRDPHETNYAGRGIAVCERWQASFAAFLADMGPKPSPQHTIERLNNDGPYSPDNCRWETRTTQANNRRSNHVLTWNNRSLTIAQWARETGIPARNIYHRHVRYHWPIPKTLSTPLRKLRT